MVAMFYLAAYSSSRILLNAHRPPTRGAGGTRHDLHLRHLLWLQLNGIPWIFASEVLPNRVRSLGMMCAVCMQWLAQFIVVYSVPYMVARITYGTFIFFGACTAVAFWFAYFFVPRPKACRSRRWICFSVSMPRFLRWRHERDTTRQKWPG